MNEQIENFTVTMLPLHTTTPVPPSNFHTHQAKAPGPVWKPPVARLGQGEGWGWAYMAGCEGRRVVGRASTLNRHGWVYLSFIALPTASPSLSFLISKMGLKIATSHS